MTDMKDNGQNSSETVLKKQISYYKNEILLQIERNQQLQTELNTVNESYELLKEKYKNTTSRYEQIIQELRLENHILNLKSNSKWNDVNSVMNQNMNVNMNTNMHGMGMNIGQPCNTGNNSLNDVRIDYTNDNYMNQSNANCSSYTTQNQIVSNNNNNSENICKVDIKIRNNNGKLRVFAIYTDNNKNNSNVETKLLCPCCEYITNKSYSMRLHFRRTHLFTKSTDLIKYKCHICNLLFDDMNDLPEHIRLHEGDAYKCDHCSRIFCSSNSLAFHKAILANQTNPKSEYDE